MGFGLQFGYSSLKVCQHWSRHFWPSCGSHIVSLEAHIESINYSNYKLTQSQERLRCLYRRNFKEFVTIKWPHYLYIFSMLNKWPSKFATSRDTELIVTECKLFLCWNILKIDNVFKLNNNIIYYVSQLSIAVTKYLRITAYRRKGLLWFTVSEVSIHGLIGCITLGLR